MMVFQRYLRMTLASSFEMFPNLILLHQACLPAFPLVSGTGDSQSQVIPVTAG